MDYKTKLSIPSLPNYVFIDIPHVGKRQDGPKFDRPKIDIKDLTVPELKQLGAEWTEALIRLSESRKNVTD